MRLDSGDPAPLFKADLWPGDTVELAELRGAPVWLAFFRHAGCQFCRLRIEEMAARHATLAACGLEVFAVVQSGRDSVTRSTGRLHPPFPVVTDPVEQLYLLYGVEEDWRGLVTPRTAMRTVEAMRGRLFPARPEGTLHRLPADFLIDEAGAVEVAHYGSDAADSIDFSVVDDFVLARA